MDNQFTRLAANPDIIIATPGRLRHLIAEVEEFELKSVEYLVFDEGDRLFEMGFQEDIQQIIQKTSPSRQTLIFSATLPSMLVSFARAGLNNPAVVRLDAETVLPETLDVQFFNVRSKEKESALMFLIKEYIPAGKKIIVFASTRHHVEYLTLLLASMYESPKGVAIYGKMDQSSRKSNLIKFSRKQADVMFVTDLAARGIDIPHLDYVINYDFPTKPKLFVHRVGRAARAGRAGTAFSLVTFTEMAYVIDLMLFLGKKLNTKYIGKDGKVSTEEPMNESKSNEKNGTDNDNEQNGDSDKEGDDDDDDGEDGNDKNQSGGGEIQSDDEIDQNQNDDDEDDDEAEVVQVDKKSKSKSKETLDSIVIQPYTSPSSSTTSPSSSGTDYGTLPPALIERLFEHFSSCIERSLELQALQRSVVNATQLYNRTKSNASPASIARMKLLSREHIHPLLREYVDEAEEARFDFLKQLKNFRPVQTVFEIKNMSGASNTTSSQNPLKDDAGISKTLNAMKQKRAFHKAIISKERHNRQKNQQEGLIEDQDEEMEDVDDGDDSGVKMSGVVSKKKDYKDDKFYIKSEAVNTHREQGFELDTGSGGNIEDIVLDLTPDDSKSIFKKKTVMQWDKKKRNYVQVTGGVDKNSKIIKNESGKLIKLDDKKLGTVYKEWSQKTKQTLGRSGEDEGDTSKMLYDRDKQRRRFRHHKNSKEEASMISTGGRNELKSVDQIRKSRREQQKKMDKMTGNKRKREESDGGGGGGGGRGGRGGRGGGRGGRGGGGRGGSRDGGPPNKRQKLTHGSAPSRSKVLKYNSSGRGGRGGGKSGGKFGRRK
eukprot:TRINITY_DN624_c0_g2_i1.p1 TRINITY_DN624_c0_g2~~TRINITY_DN624_c0_g2_i1.p1  ORF type:complete len:957 (-),score=341.90 TRINITY_DN624_c0_g2_i1:109-2583(-)